MFLHEWTRALFSRESFPKLQLYLRRMFLYSAGTMLDDGGGWKWKTRCREGGSKSSPPYVLYNKVDLLWNVRIWASDLSQRSVGGRVPGRETWHDSSFRAELNNWVALTVCSFSFTKCPNCTFNCCGRWFWQCMNSLCRTFFFFRRWWWFKNSRWARLMACCSQPVKAQLCSFWPSSSKRKTRRECQDCCLASSQWRLNSKFLSMWSSHAIPTTTQCLD